RDRDARRRASGILRAARRARTRAFAVTLRDRRFVPKEAHRRERAACAALLTSSRTRGVARASLPARRVMTRARSRSAVEDARAIPERAVEHGASQVSIRVRRAAAGLFPHRCAEPHRSRITYCGARTTACLA